MIQPAGNRQEYHRTYYIIDKLKSPSVNIILCTKTGNRTSFKSNSLIDLKNIKIEAEEQYIARYNDIVYLFQAVAISQQRYSLPP